MLKVKPLKYYNTPKYPTQTEFLSGNGLSKYMPKHWYAKPAVCTALIFTIASGLVSCASNDEKAESAEIKIPIFEHGDGISSYGCSSVCPPVYLSEGEAAQIIREEALKSGIDFNLYNRSEINSNKLPATVLDHIDNKDKYTYSGNLKLDGYDSKLGIGFEFVSHDDIIEWEAENYDGPISTVSVFDSKDTAVRLADALDNTAVFYDPMMQSEHFKWFNEMTDAFYSETETMDLEAERTFYEQLCAEFEQRVKNDIEENLREQVRDFAEWLIAQGII